MLDLPDEGFESLYARLEAVSQQLEEGGLTLEQSLALYEEGMHLAQRCQALLSNVDMQAEVVRIAALPPRTATGTIGHCASMAIMKPPFLNGSSSPVRLRVPSGKMRNELPARIDRAPSPIEASAFSRFPRSTATKPPTSKTVPINGTLCSSAL